MDIIYIPKGRALEYSRLACNVATSCSLQCAYCYVPLILHRDRGGFHYFAGPKEKILTRLEKEAPRYAGQGPVLFSFTADPFQPGLEAITHEAIRICNSHGVPVTILTKRPSVVNLSLLGQFEGNELATTLTTMEAEKARRWEPGADSPEDRLRALLLARLNGIRNWVSMEPVIWPEDSLAIIRVAHNYVDHFKIGRLNYAGTLPEAFRREVPVVDWPSFRITAVALMESLGLSYYIKQDLAEAA